MTSAHSRGVLPIILGVWAPVVCPETARAETAKNYKQIFSGVEYLSERRTEPRHLSIHVLKIRTSVEGVRFIVTRPNPSRSGPNDEVVLKTTSAFARTSRVQAAINGTFFYVGGKGPYMSGLAAGISFLAVYDGTVYSRRSSEHEGIVCCKGARFRIWTAPEPCKWQFKPGDGQMALGMASWAKLLYNGRVIAPRGKALHPRTAVGISRDGKTAYWVVVDGRQKGLSEGMSLRELAALMSELGAFNALNLDGGGSSTMVIQQSDGTYRVVNRPCGYLPLVLERPVGTHMGLYARPIKSNK